MQIIAGTRIGLTKPERKTLASAAATLVALTHFDPSLKAASEGLTAALKRIGEDGTYIPADPEREPDCPDAS